MLIKMRTDSIVVAEYTSDGDSTLRLTNKEERSLTVSFKIKLLRSNFQYIVSCPVRRRRSCAGATRVKDCFLDF